LKRELVDLRLQKEKLRQRLEETSQVLQEIERSRSFALVRAWWWLRGQRPAGSRTRRDPGLT
jgi:hypothetical protein